MPRGGARSRDQVAIDDLTDDDLWKLQEIGLGRPPLNRHCQLARAIRRAPPPARPML